MLSTLNRPHSDIRECADMGSMLDLGIAAPVQLHMSSGLRDGFQPEQPRTIATTTPTRLAGWIRDELAPVL